MSTCKIKQFEVLPTMFLSCFVLFCLSGCVQGIVDYCAENTFKTNTTWMEFNKENSIREFAIDSKFKSLHCCAEGYRSIEWYKDGKAYPWHGGLSSFILYPESANQTVYSQSVIESDAGNYSCLVRNDTHTYSHTVNLTVIESSSYSGIPLATYRPMSAVVELGDEARLFCEAFVGHINLPDTRNEVSWKRCDSNSSLPLQNRLQQIRVSREDDLVVGSYLLIHGVQEEDYGEYQCSISNTWFQVLEVQVRLLRAVEFLEEPMQQRLYKQDFLLLSAVLLFLVALFALYLRFGLQLRVIWKDACGYKETNDGKEYDVLVCYNDADCDFVLGVIVPTLETRYNYRCCSHHVSPNSLGKTWPAELNSLAQRSRRLLAVLSPSMLAGNWTSADLYYALYTLLRIHSKVVCISLKKLPLCDSEKTPHNESLAVLLQAAPVVEWYSNVGREERARFWGALRLRLPPRHPFQGSDSSDSLDQITVSGSTKKRTLLTNSHESLEVLV